MNKQQKDKYCTNALYCPYCEGTALEETNSFRTWEDNYQTLCSYPIVCNSCGKQWREIWKIINMEEVIGDE